MPYNEKLAERVRAAIKGKRNIVEKKMFGGLCYLYNGNMAFGVENDRLMVRVGLEKYDWALKQKHVKVMEFTGRPMTGFVSVQPEGIKGAVSLKKWIEHGIEYAKLLPKK